MVNRKLLLGRILSWVWVALLIGRAAAEPLPDRASGGVALRVSGAVQHPLTLTMPDLRALPAAEPSGERDGQSHRARGVDLLALVDRAGLKLNRATRRVQVGTRTSKL